MNSISPPVREWPAVESDVTLEIGWPVVRELAGRRVEEPQAVTDCEPMVARRLGLTWSHVTAALVPGSVVKSSSELFSWDPDRLELLAPCDDRGEAGEVPTSARSASLGMDPCDPSVDQRPYVERRAAFEIVMMARVVFVHRFIIAQSAGKGRNSS